MRGRRAGTPRGVACWALAALWLLPAAHARAWEPDEHASLARASLHAVIAEGALPFDPATELAPGLDFAALSAWSARHDHTAPREHSRGRTVLQQLARLRRDRLAHFLDGRDRGGESESLLGAAHPAVAEQPSNVVENYLIHHLQALHRAHAAGRAGVPPGEGLRPALVSEAVALGYLADAFASDHMLIPPRGPLSALQRRNYGAAQHHYASYGLYVLDGRGDVWQAFGSGLLDWYRSSRDHVGVACLASVRELAAAFHLAGGAPMPEALARWLGEEYADGNLREHALGWLEIVDGGEYYERQRMPALVRIPVPVCATWSVKQGTPDPHGIRPRHHYPQLADHGFHDPDLDGSERALLPGKDAVAGWSVMPRLDGSNARELVRTDPDVASVRYVQDFRRAPTFAGGLLTVGAGYAAQGPAEGAAYSVGLGFGLFDEILPTRRLPSLHRFGLEAGYVPRLGSRGRSLMSASWSAQIGLPGWGRLHVQSGYAWGVGTSLREKGPLYAVGVASGSLPLPFTYAGALLRIKYQWLDLRPTVGGPGVELVLH